MINKCMVCKMFLALASKAGIHSWTEQVKGSGMTEDPPVPEEQDCYR